MENEFKTLRDYLDYLLKERKQTGVIYHFTRLSSLENILKSGYLESHEDYISFTRNSLMAVQSLYKNHFSSNSEYNVRIKINGDILSDHYKIEPFLDNFNYITRRQGENEERIKSPRVFIDRCILEIHVLRNKDKVKILQEKNPEIKILSVQNFGK